MCPSPLCGSMHEQIMARRHAWHGTQTIWNGHPKDAHPGTPDRKEQAILHSSFTRIFPLLLAHSLLRALLSILTVLSAFSSGLWQEVLQVHQLGLHEDVRLPRLLLSHLPSLQPVPEVFLAGRHWRRQHLDRVVFAGADRRQCHIHQCRQIHLSIFVGEVSHVIALPREAGLPVDLRQVILGGHVGAIRHLGVLTFPRLIAAAG
mmetsp:Transcript_32273/g.93345  ORF Transcript_32273/g.93345 Transcript_32273/m.93345 type:complete len:204 (-) Transcript_32273:360-971(-)